MDGESLEPIEGSAVMLNLFQHPASSDLAGGKLDPETKVRVTNGQCNPRASSPEIRKASMAYPISLYIRNGSIVRCGSSLSMFYSPAAKGAFAMQGLRLIAVASIAGAVFIGGGVANARFLQVDPVGYKDQVNLYAYVNNDPVNNGDPTGTTCTSSQQDGKTVYACRIDTIATVNKKGEVTGVRPANANDDKKFAVFNKRYTAAVNQLMSRPDRTVTVAPVKDGEGSFKTTARQAAASLISRQFLYATRDHKDQAMATIGGPGLGREPSTYVRPKGLFEGKMGIVHDGGLHGTPEEATGKLQRRGDPLGGIDHQQQYNDAACTLLRGDC